MPRSLKKGPFVDDHLAEKVAAVNAAAIALLPTMQSFIGVLLDAIAETISLLLSNRNWPCAGRR